MKTAYAQRTASVKSSEIRELLKLTENPEVISFAGGLPAPELFPVPELQNLCVSVLERDGHSALQYATTEGHLPLRQWVAHRMNATQGTLIDEDAVLITNGSQQALDLAGKVFIDEGDVIVCESPTYLAAITAFRVYGCRFVEVPTDEHGMQTQALEDVLARTKNVKLIYVIPNFQNPTGRTMSLERRKRVAELAAKYRVMVLEDNPYGELRFEGESLPSIQSFDTAGRVLYAGTFSKILCPGFRVGWLAGDKEIIGKHALMKQGSDLQSNTFTQHLISAYLKRHDIDVHIRSLLAVYKKRRDVTLAAMERLFPPSVHFTRPEGGLFVWVTVPKGIDTHALLTECLKENVAFVPGSSFFPDGGHENTMRINFSNMEEERIERGMAILAAMIERFAAENS